MTVMLTFGAVALAMALSSTAPAIQGRGPVPPAAPGGTNAGVPADLRAQILTYLGSVDVAITPAQWRALGPEAARVLEELAQDQKLLPTRRARALGALGIVGTARSSKLAVDLAQRDTEKPIVRMSAARAAGQLLDPAALTTALVPVLRAPDLHVRAAVAETLATHAPATCAQLRDQSAHEKPDARPAFTRALRTCDALPAKP